MELTIFKPRLKFKPPLKFFKFGHWLTLIGDGLNLDRYVSRTCYGVGVYYILTSLRSAYLFAYLPTSLQSYLSPYLPTYLPTYLPASQPILKLSTYLSTYKKWKNRVNKVKNLLFWNKKIFLLLLVIGNKRSINVNYILIILSFVILNVSMKNYATGPIQVPIQLSIRAFLRTSRISQMFLFSIYKISRK